MNNNSSLKIIAKVSDLERIRHYVESKVKTFQVDSSDIDDILLVTTEAVTNILVHGYRGKPGLIEIEVKIEKDRIVVCLRDQAPHFDPTQIPSPDLTSPLAKRPLGGMGTHLMRQFTDQIRYRAIPEVGNEIILIKHCVVSGGFQEDSDF